MFVLFDHTAFTLEPVSPPRLDSWLGRGDPLRVSTTFFPFDDLTFPALSVSSTRRRCVGLRSALGIGYTSQYGLVTWVLVRAMGISIESAITRMRGKDINVRNKTYNPGCGDCGRINTKQSVAFIFLGRPIHRYPLGDEILQRVKSYKAKSVD